MSIDAMKQALKFCSDIGDLDGPYPYVNGTRIVSDSRKVLPVLRQAIADAEKQEPVAQYSDIVSDGGLDPRNTAHVYASDISQERVDKTAEDRHGACVTCGALVEDQIIKQPKREWVGLADEEWVKELGAIRAQVDGDVFGSFYRAIEAKLKEKNINNTLEPQTPIKESFHKEWIGLDHEVMRNTPIEFRRGALWAERYLKEKNT